VKAGTDLTCGNEYARWWTREGGQITEAEINRSLERLFVARLDWDVRSAGARAVLEIPYSENDSAEHRKIALEAARKSIVLLKNESRRCR